MTLQETIVIIIAAIGVIFTIISAVGIVRLPDVYARMHAAAKASTLGVSAILLSAGVHFPDDFPLLVVMIFLFFVTAPVATTTMARATYRTDPDRHFVLNHDDMATMGQNKPHNQPRRRQTGKRK